MVEAVFMLYETGTLDVLLLLKPSPTHPPPEAFISTDNTRVVVEVYPEGRFSIA